MTRKERIETINYLLDNDLLSVQVAIEATKELKELKESELKESKEEVKTEVKEDEISPSHYPKINGVEMFDIFKNIAESYSHYEGYLHLTALKYLVRFHKKDDKLINLKKCRKFLDKLIGELDGSNTLNKKTL